MSPPNELGPPSHSGRNQEDRTSHPHPHTPHPVLSQHSHPTRFGAAQPCCQLSRGAIYQASTAGGVCLPPFLSDSWLLQGLSRPTRLLGSNSWVLDWFSQCDYQSAPLSGIHRLSHLLGMKPRSNGGMVRTQIQSLLCLLCLQPGLETHLPL